MHKTSFYLDFLAIEPQGVFNGFFVLVLPPLG
jgi:hypothetical protein